MSVCVKRRILASVLLVMLCHANVVGDDADAQPIVTAAVKQLQRAEPVASDRMPIMSMANASPPATLPAERLPQYRVGYQRTDTMLQSQVNEGTVRFLLTNPTILEHADRPLIVEATVLINGEPFSNVREQFAAKVAAKVAIAPTEVIETIEAIEGDAAKVAEQPADNKVSPANETAYRLTSDPKETMRRYADAIGQSVEQAEAEWLMTHWTDGPTLLVLHPYYQNFRAEQRPVFVVLDKDRDGVLSSAELDAAAESFRRCDANRDDIVDAIELAKAADKLRDPTATTKPSGPLFWLLPDLVGVSEKDPVLYQSIAALDTNQNGQIEAAEIEQLGKQTPDIRLSVSFQSDFAAASKLHVIEVNQSRNIAVDANQRGDGVNLSIGSLMIHLSAIQSAAFLPHAGQISIGAVVDGYPLMPELDPNADGRFTIRELRTLTQRVREKDRDADNVISPDECLSPIRLCIGLGPIVHEELANVRSVLPTTVVETVSGPEWFVRMDRNQDGDLTRGEFPGTDEQFGALDADGDSLVSPSEANEFEKQADQ